MYDGVTLNWIGGEHEFALRLGELRKLQEVCGAGPEEIYARLQAGRWHIDDLIEPIRLGLIGSETMKQSEAGPFVIKLFEQNPMMHFRLTATSILQHALVGNMDDVPKKPEGEARPPEESGSSVPSTESEAK